MTSPVFGLRRPEGSSDEVIVGELERQAAEILGPWNKKEYHSLVEVCGGNLRLNRCLAEMGVAYEARPVPANAVPRMTPPGNIGSEVPGSKSRGKAKVEEAGSSGMLAREVAGAVGNLRARRFLLRGLRAPRGRRKMRRFLRAIAVRPHSWKSSWGRWAGRL